MKNLAEARLTFTNPCPHVVKEEDGAFCDGSGGDCPILFLNSPIKSGGSKPPPYVKYSCPTEPRQCLTTAFVSTRYFANAQYDKLVICHSEPQAKNLAEAAIVGSRLSII